MKKTPQQKEEEKKRVREYMHDTADLNVQNTSIVWKTGVYIAVLLIVLFLVSYHVRGNVIAWLIFLMPIGAHLISRKYGIRITRFDIQFHIAWQNMWNVAAVLAVIPCCYTELSVCIVLAVYYISLITGIFMLFESMRVRYASMVMCAAVGIGATGIQFAFAPEVSVRWCLVIFTVFDIIVFMIGGAMMQWQINNRIKNPISFPQYKNKNSMT